jgi:hypothetical protein
MHALRRGSGDTMEACVHRMLYRSAVQSSGRVSLSGLWPKAELGSTMGSDLVYSILSPEWNADKTRVDKVRYWTAVARLFRGIDLAGRLGGWIYGGGWIWS